MHLRCRVFILLLQIFVSRQETTAEKRTETTAEQRVHTRAHARAHTHTHTTSRTWQPHSSGTTPTAHEAFFVTRNRHLCKCLACCMCIERQHENIILILSRLEARLVLKPTFDHALPTLKPPMLLSRFLPKKAWCCGTGAVEHGWTSRRHQSNVAVDRRHGVLWLPKTGCVIRYWATQRSTLPFFISEKKSQAKSFLF